MSKYTTSKVVGIIMRDAIQLALKASEPLLVEHVNKAYEKWIHDYRLYCTSFSEEPDQELVNSVGSVLTLLCSNFKE